MSKQQALIRYLLRLGDNALVLGQRLIENVTKAPELEEELANANFSLDYIGQARLYYSYAGELEGKGRDEDDFAFLRDDNEYENVLLVEQPNGHFGDSLLRSVLFDSFYLLQLEALVNCSDEHLAGIAARAAKEIRYHLRHGSQWLVRLGDGTSESRERVQQSLDDLWQYTGELFATDECDTVIRDQFRGPDLEIIRTTYLANLSEILAEATLTMPADQWMASGGRQGRHSENFAYLIAELQHMQRRYPGLSW